MLFLAHILNRPVVDAAGTRLGWVEDLVLTSLDLFPKVEAFVLGRRGHRAVFIPWDQVRQTDHTGLHLRSSRERIPTSPLNDDAILLRRDILDKQVVDIYGRKVVRINDLQLADIDHELRLIGADIGARGLLRRLNIERPLAMAARGMRVDLPERVIPWNYVEGLETEWPSVRLNVSHRRLRDLPPPEIAEILEQLHPVDRDELLLHFDDETVADTLPHMEDDVQAEVLMAMSDERASDILEFLPPDEAADVLGDLSEERAERLLHLMEPEEAEDVRELMQYGDDTAGGRMTTEFLALVDEISVAEAMVQLRRFAPDAETVYYVYVVDEGGRMEGVLSLRDLITASPDTPLSTITHSDIIRVHVEDDQETVAHTLNHYHLLAVPVVDDAGVLRGIVTVDDVLDVLHEEAEEDISRMSGATEESDVLATPWEQVVLRLPWVAGIALIGLLAAGYLAMQARSPQAVSPALLALLPLLVIIGAHIGGQSAAAMQVALRNGDDIRDILLALSRHQWPLGVGISILGGLVSGIITLMLGLPLHALAAGSVVALVLVLDLLIGSFLPLLLHRLRWDPVLINRPALAGIALLLGIPLLAQVL